MNLLRGALGAACLAAMAVPASAYDLDDDWHLTLTPYVWVPGVNGDFNLDPPPGAVGKPEINIGPVDVLDLLQAAFMGSADIRIGRWGMFGDFVYVDLSDDGGLINSITGPGGITETPTNLSTETSLTGEAFTTGITYAFYQTYHSYSSLFAGLRYMHTEPAVTWSFAVPVSLLPQAGTIKQSTDSWDAIIGIKGRVGFGGSGWFADYYGDVGTGESDFTGQAMAAIGYEFGWADLKLAYRYLHYSGSGGSLIDDFDLYGPAVGLSFNF